MAKYLNIDEIVPDEQIIEIAGRRFDISRTPARATARMLQINSWAHTPEVEGDQSRGYEAYEKEMTAMLDVLGKDQDGEAVTFDWAMDNISMSQLTKLMEFVGDCLNGRDTADGETAGNFTKGKKDKAKK